LTSFPGINTLVLSKTVETAQGGGHMPGFDVFLPVFVVTAFLVQIILITHFALRRWHFETAIRYGPFVYAFGIVAFAASIVMLLGNMPLSFWLSGFLYLVWGLFGYVVEYRKKIQWRNPIRWSIFGPYIFLYLAMMMFYWFPLALIWKPLWYIYAVLFIISTVLNVTSHKVPEIAHLEKVS
jgi:hypothetical protein